MAREVTQQEIDACLKIRDKDRVICLVNTVLDGRDVAVICCMERDENDDYALEPLAVLVDDVMFAGLDKPE